MLKELAKGEVVKTQKFGCPCPYYYISESNRVFVADSFPEIASIVPEHRRQIDPVAVLNLFGLNYIAGDRTILKGLYRMPWHSELHYDGNLMRHNPVRHGYKLKEPKQIARVLVDCLGEEFRGYIGERKKVYILLSGGFDSRISACILKQIQKERDFQVVALTWGARDSRDVVYSCDIARILQWDWLHLPYGEEDLWRNIEIASSWGGAEVSGIHFHAMQRLESILDKSDVIIASSWGDSIGRAEFSGTHLTNLQPPKPENKHFLISHSIAKELIETAAGDMALAWCSEPDQSSYVKNELNMQENYMRRMIGHAMNYLNNCCTLNQAFTSEKTVSVMWSLNPFCRTNAVYFELFKMLNYPLYDYPWARTGIGPSGKIDNRPLKTTYHEWGAWMRQRLYRRLKELVLNGGLHTLGIFNMHQVRTIFRLWANQEANDRSYNETILKLAGLELLRKEFRLNKTQRCFKLPEKMFSWAYYVAKKYG